MDKCTSTHTRAHTHTHTHTHMRVRACAHTHVRAETNRHARTHTHTHTGKTDYSVAGEGETKRAASGPFGTFCHHVVTKRAGVTERVGCASNLTQ